MLVEYEVKMKIKTKFKCNKPFRNLETPLEYAENLGVLIAEVTALRDEEIEIVIDETSINAKEIHKI